MAPLPDWWGGSPAPLVYLTFGTVLGFMSIAVDVYRTALEALADVDARVLLTVGRRFDAAALCAVPDHVPVEAWVEHDRVLAEVDLVVCHGGSGRRVVVGTADVPRIAAAVAEALVAPALARRAEEIAAEMAATPEAGAVVAELLSGRARAAAARRSGRRRPQRTCRRRLAPSRAALAFPRNLSPRTRRRSSESVPQPILLLHGSRDQCRLSTLGHSTCKLTCARQRGRPRALCARAAGIERPLGRATPPSRRRMSCARRAHRFRGRPLQGRVHVGGARAAHGAPRAAPDPRRSLGIPGLRGFSEFSAPSALPRKPPSA